jgi:hypothetical protein
MEARQRCWRGLLGSGPSAVVDTVALGARPGARRGHGDVHALQRQGDWGAGTRGSSHQPWWVRDPCMVATETMSLTRGVRCCARVGGRVWAGSGPNLEMGQKAKLFLS